MPIERDEDTMVEEAVGAWRPENPDGSIRFHPSWLDLAADARERVFEETLKSRRLEAAMNGTTSTAARVLAKIRGAG